MDECLTKLTNEDDGDTKTKLPQTKKKQRERVRRITRISNNQTGELTRDEKKLNFLLLLKLCNQFSLSNKTQNQQVEN